MFYYHSDFSYKVRKQSMIIIKCILLIVFIIISFCSFLYYDRRELKNNDSEKNIEINKFQINTLIDENFFIIDSNSLETINTHLYGFTISEEGILTDNYYKMLGYYKDPHPQGVYIMIRKQGNIIKLNQDFYGSFGIYLFQNKETGYFALSNSFLLLEEYLIGKQNLSFNKEFSDNFIISELCTPSIYETMIKEIIKLPSNIYITVNIKKQKFKIYYIDYKENTIPYDSPEGLKIIDN